MPCTNRRSSRYGSAGKATQRCACSVGRARIRTPGRASSRRAGCGSAGPRRQVPEVPLDELDDLPVRQVTCRRHDQPIRPVMLREIGEQLLPRDRLHGLLGADDRSTDRMAGPQCLIDEIVDVVVRRIADAADLLDDHVPLFLQFGGIEERMLQHVGEDIERQLQMLARHLHPVIGVFPARRGIHDATHPLDRLADQDRIGPARCSLEEHVLEKMGNAGHLVALVPRSHPYVHDDRRRTHVCHPARDDAYAVRKLCLLVFHTLHSFPGTIGESVRTNHSRTAFSSNRSAASAACSMFSQRVPTNRYSSTVTPCGPAHAT